MIQSYTVCAVNSMYKNKTCRSVNQSLNDTCHCARVKGITVHLQGRWFPPTIVGKCPTPNMTLGKQTLDFYVLTLLSIPYLHFSFQFFVSVALEDRQPIFALLPFCFKLRAWDWPWETVPQRLGMFDILSINLSACYFDVVVD